MFDQINAAFVNRKDLFQKHEKILPNFWTVVYTTLKYKFI